MKTRALLFLILPSYFLLCASCASPRISARYSPPSVAPVRQRISDAQSHAEIARNSLSSIPSSELRNPKSALALQRAAREIDALTYELTVAQTALDSLQKQTSDQTDSLNRATQEKNAALSDADEAKHRYHRLKFFACLLGAGAALILVMRLRVLTLVPPPYNFIGAGALPLIVYGFLWIRL